MDFSLEFPLGREYLLSNTAVLLKPPPTAVWEEFIGTHASVSDQPVRNDSGEVEDCPLCLDCLDPEHSQGHWTTETAMRDANIVKNDKCQHVFHTGCFYTFVRPLRNTCPMCQTPFVNTQDEVDRALAVTQTLRCMAAGDCETTAGLTELPIEIHGAVLVYSCLCGAYHLRNTGIGGQTPEDEQQYAPNGVADHVDGRRSIECLLQAIGKRHGRMCLIQDFSEQLPSRAATIWREQHPDVAYTHGMWRFVSDVARIGLICYAKHQDEWLSDL